MTKLTFAQIVKILSQLNAEERVWKRQELIYLQYVDPKLVDAAYKKVA